MTYKSKIVFGFSCFIVFFVFTFINPIPQPEKYNIFADTRVFFGIKNFFDMISNSVFLIIGLMGIVLEMQKKLVQDRLPEIPLYRILFIGVFLTGVGSIYFHLSPNNDRLVWDRLPMTIVFMSLTAGLLSEHLGLDWQRRLFYPLLLLGMASVWYWHVTEQMGRGDLRPYLLVQFLPLLLLPLVMLSETSGFDRRGMIWWMLVCYLLAKLCELYDGEIWQWSGWISGHTLKHLLAAAALLLLLHMLYRRQRA